MIEMFEGRELEEQLYRLNTKREYQDGISRGSLNISTLVSLFH